METLNDQSLNPSEPEIPDPAPQTPICGARTLAGTPCQLPPNHPNGRCKFHGRFDLTGAPKGNRNAMLHGLYSRRLRVCSPQCPQWTSCPCAGPEIAAVPPPERPTCPYEQTEYNAALTDALALIDQHKDPNPFMRHIAHDLALLHVMLSRAAIALSNAPLVDDPPLAADPSKAAQTRPKPSAAHQAYMRIAAEFRRTYQLLLPRDPSSRDIEKWREHHARSELDTDTTLETNAQREPVPAPPPTDDDLARQQIEWAIECAAYNHKAALAEWREACELKPEIARAHIDEVVAAWRRYKPDGNNVPADRKTFEKLLREALPSP